MQILFYYCNFLAILGPKIEPNRNNEIKLANIPLAKYLTNRTFGLCKFFPRTKSRIRQGLSVICKILAFSLEFQNFLSITRTIYFWDKKCVILVQTSSLSSEKKPSTFFNQMIMFPESKKYDDLAAKEWQPYKETIEKSL